MRNIMLSADGESSLCYAETLTVEEVKNWFELKVAPVDDAYEVQDDELQYYLIDDRIWLGQKEEQKIRKDLQV